MRDHIITSMPSSALRELGGFLAAISVVMEEDESIECTEDIIAIARRIFSDGHIALLKMHLKDFADILNRM